MTTVPFTAMQVAEARRINKLIEDDWKDRYDRSLPCSGQAEASYRIETYGKLNK